MNKEPLRSANASPCLGMFNALPDLACILSADDRVDAVNPVWMREFAGAGHDAAAVAFLDLVHPHDQDQLRDCLRKLRVEGRAQRVCARLHRAENDWRDLDLSLGCAGAGRIVVIARDSPPDRARLAAAIEALEDGFVLFDAEDRLVLCNSRYRALHAPISDVIRPGVAFGDILRAGLDCNLFPQAIGQQDAWLARNLRRPPPEGHELEVDLADGRWIRIVERPTPEGGRVGLRIDITRQVESRHRAEKAEADARHARARLTAAIEALQDGFVLFDAQDRLVLCNRRYREIYPGVEPVLRPGVTFEEILRKSLEVGEIADALGREEDWIAERMRLHRQTTGAFEQHLANGRVLRIYETPTADGGRVGLRIDVTELHHARARAEAASQTKSDFLSNMSHEIRTPLNGVLGMADLLAETTLDQSQRDMLDTIRASGWDLLSLLNDILDLARVESGKLRLDARPFGLRDLLGRIEALHGAAARAKGVALEMRCDGPDDMRRIGDESRVAQILHNVVGNAVKFTEAGSVHVDVCSQNPRQVEIAVHDTGVGMTQEQVARIFEAFEQAEAGTTRRFGGTGLGMSIVRKLVELMQGRIDVESRPGQGTSVYIRLHLPQPEEVGSAETTAPAPVPEGVARLSHCNVLVADDNAANRKILSLLLAGLGLNAEFVCNGGEACTIWAARDFDLVLLDISMPVMGGVEALDKMRLISAEQGRAAPTAVAVTANVMHEQLAQYRAAGFVDVISKPIRRANLEAVLAQHLDRAEV